MAHTSVPRFLVLEQGIINVEDISTVVPYGPREGNVDPAKAGGVTVTFMSKATWLDLPGQTIEGFASLLNGAVF